MIGVGGSGMSSLCHILIEYGITVIGQDKNKGKNLDLLERKGLVTIEDTKSKPKFDFAIYSSAIDIQNNIYYLYCLDNNIPLFHRSNVLHSIFSEKKSISVAGSHGKTSTTAMISQILFESNLDPSIMIGGETSLLNGSGGRYGSGYWGIYESDESDGTFLNHHADLKVLTNIDNDHMDFYKEDHLLKSAFEKYLFENQNSKVIACLDDPGINNLIQINLEKISNENFIFYSDQPNHNLPSIPYKIVSHELYFTYNQKQYTISLPIYGNHFLKNALAAVLTANEIGLDPTKSINILKNFCGVKRRMELKGTLGNIQFYDDYGHHPTEIDVVSKALKNIKEKSRSIVLFQPHRFTRTKNHYKEFGESLSKCDFVFLLPIYSAGESPIDGVNSELIQSHITSPVEMLSGNIEEDCKKLIKFLKNDDIFLTLGAGNVYEWGEFLLKMG
jgi:UDP-N-acetylmuramate--alanine ligase